MNDTFLLLFLAGVAVLVARGPSWFGGAGPVRSYTTAFRYYAGLLVYVAILVILFTAPLAGIAYRNYRLAEEGVAVAPIGAAPPVLALLAVALLVRLPFGSNAQGWLSRVMQKAIGVPSEAGSLTEALLGADLGADLKVPADVKDDVMLLLRGRGYEPDEAWLSVAEPMRGLWLKTAIIFCQVRRWTSDRHYRGFVRSNAEEFELLHQRFDQLSLKVVRVLDTVERLGSLLPEVGPEAAANPGVALPTPRGAEKIRRIVTEVLSDLREDIAFLLRYMCLLIARGVLARSLTAAGSRRHLRKMGFELAPPPRSAGYVWALAWAGYFVIFLSSSLPLDKKVMIPTVLVVPWAAAMVPKSRGIGFANEDLAGRTPWRFVLFSGVISVLLFVPTRFLVLGLFWGLYSLFPDLFSRLSSLFPNLFKIDKPTPDNLPWYPWLLSPLVTTATAAFLAQDSRWSRFPSKLARRFADGLVLGAAVIGAGFGSFLWLGILGYSSSMRWQEALWLTGASGFFAGMLVPGHFRREDLALRPRRAAAGQGIVAQPAPTGPA